MTRRFDLEAGPVVAATLIRLAEDSHALLVVCHHIAADGWSMGILADELRRALYEDALIRCPRRAGRDPRAVRRLRRLVARRAHPRDAREPRRLLARSTLGGTEARRPADAARTAGARRAAHHTNWSLLAPGTLAALQAAGGPGTTPFTALLAVFSMLLARYTGTDGVTLATTNGGQPARASSKASSGASSTRCRSTATCPAIPPSPSRGRGSGRRSAARLSNPLPLSVLADAVDLKLPVSFSLRGFRDQRGDWPGLTASIWDHEVDHQGYELSLLVHLDGDVTGLDFTYRRDLLDDDVVEPDGPSLPPPRRPDRGEPGGHAGRARPRDPGGAGHDPRHVERLGEALSRERSLRCWPSTATRPRPPCSSRTGPPPTPTCTPAPTRSPAAWSTRASPRRARSGCCWTARPT